MPGHCRHLTKARVTGTLMYVVYEMLMKNKTDYSIVPSRTKQFTMNVMKTEHIQYFFIEHFYYSALFRINNITNDITI